MTANNNKVQSRLNLIFYFHTDHWLMHCAAQKRNTEWNLITLLCVLYQILRSFPDIVFSNERVDAWTFSMLMIAARCYTISYKKTFSTASANIYFRETDSDNNSRALRKKGENRLRELRVARDSWRKRVPSESVTFFEWTHQRRGQKWFLLPATQNLMKQCWQKVENARRVGGTPFSRVRQKNLSDSEESWVLETCFIDLA